MSPVFLAAFCIVTVPRTHCAAIDIFEKLVQLHAMAEQPKGPKGEHQLIHPTTGASGSIRLRSGDLVDIPNRRYMLYRSVMRHSASSISPSGPLWCRWRASLPLDAALQKWRERIVEMTMNAPMETKQLDQASAEAPYSGIR